MKFLMVIAPENFRDEELEEPKNVLEQAGIDVTIASRTDKAKGMLGKEVEVDKDLSDVNSDDYDGVVFVGGTGTAKYFNDPEVLDLARAFYENDKVIGAICIAPSILANAGLLENKKATCFPSERENLLEKKCEFVEKGVVADGLIVTSAGPKYAKDFGEKILELMKFKESDINFATDDEDDEDIYNEKSREKMLEDDEITPEEEGFMEGRELSSKQEKKLLDEEKD